jgi:hypothetical protein
MHESVLKDNSLATNAIEMGSLDNVVKRWCVGFCINPRLATQVVDEKEKNIWTLVGGRPSSPHATEEKLEQPAHSRSLRPAVWLIDSQGVEVTFHRLFLVRCGNLRQQWLHVLRLQ